MVGRNVGKSVDEAMAIQQTEEFSQMLLEDECEPDDLKGVEEHFRRVVKAMFDPESAYLVVSFMNEAFTNERLHNLAVTLMKNFREQVLDICKSERPFSREEMEAQVVFCLPRFAFCDAISSKLEQKGSDRCGCRPLDAHNSP